MKEKFIITRLVPDQDKNYDFTRAESLGSTDGKTHTFDTYPQAQTFITSDACGPGVYQIQKVFVKS